jgi:hypothetical protein
MKNTAALLKDAKKIITHEHLSSVPKTDFNSKAGKRLRRFFMLTCVAEIGAPFTDRLAGYISS